MRLTFGINLKRNRDSWFRIAANGGWEFHRYATSYECDSFRRRVAKIADEDVIETWPYCIYTSLQQIPVTIELASPIDASTMAQLKFANLMHRVCIGTLTMSANEIELAKVTDESVSKLATTLASSDEKDHFLVGKHDGEVVGFCRMTWRSDAEQFQFQQFYAQPQLTGKNIGSQLMAAAKARAYRSDFGAAGIFLYTGDYNKSAQSMYEHWGFCHRPRSESMFEGEIEWVKMVFAL